MSKIDEVVIETIRKETDIIDLIGEHVQLTKRGKNWFGLCPFHDEQSPSFSVSEDKQLYHCFGCGASGNAISFLMELEHRTFVDAVATLASRLGIELDIAEGQRTARDEEESHTEKLLKAAHAQATQFYHHLLMNTVEGERALQYLYERGFTEQQLIEHQIGWTLNQSDSLLRVLQDDYPLPLLVEGGLLTHFEDRDQYYDRFRERIMFPLRNERGEVVGFSGRIIEKKEGAPKYLNSPETPIFKKNQLLYNLDRAKSPIRKANEVILFEGFMDTLAAEREGILEAVAVMGTALSEQHIIQMRRLTNRLIICCDGDDAGWEASYRFSKFATEHKMDVTIAILPQNMDPDDYMKTYGGKQFRERILEMSHSFMSFMIQYARRGKNLSLDYEVEQYIHEVLTELAERRSIIERDLIIQQLAELTTVQEATLREKLAQLTTRQVPERQTSEVKRTIPETKRKKRRSEVLLFAHLLHERSLFNLAIREGIDIFIDDDFTTLFVRLAAYYEISEGEGDSFAQSFAEQIEERELRELAMFCIAYERAEDDTDQEVKDCIQHLKKLKIVEQIEDKIQQSKQLEQQQDLEGALALIQEVIELKKLITP